jgi:hypothetical protein
VTRVAGAAQHEVMRRRTGTVTVCGGPGSAVHRSALHTHPGHDISGFYYPDYSEPVTPFVCLSEAILSHILQV